MNSALVFCIALPILVLIGWLVIRSQAIHRQREELNAAYTSYQSALVLLKANPTSADLKQRALAFGHAYSSLTSEIKGTPVYDQIALMADINAAMVDNDRI